MSLRNPNTVSMTVAMATLVLTLAALMWLPVRWASADDAATPIRVYYTADEARHKIFPEAVRFELETHFIPRQAKLDLEGQLGRSFAEDSLKVYLAYDADNLAGYAVVSNEIGKYQPITFMVGVTVDFRVQGAAILIYRESRGAEVRRTRFLKQYRDKTSRDPIRINRDIVNITGATLSVRALNFGVRKLLAITEHLYGHRAAFK